MLSDRHRPSIQIKPSAKFSLTLLTSAVPATCPARATCLNLITLICLVNKTNSEAPQFPLIYTLRLLVLEPKYSLQNPVPQTQALNYILPLGAETHSRSYVERQFKFQISQQF
jgi:hypothetical protein